MDYFHYQNRELYCEEVPTAELAAKYGTPLWVYSKRTLLHHIRQIQTAFADVDPVLCYSVKSNSNLGILRVMHEAGSSFDVVSGGEFYRVKASGGDTSKVIFAGGGKTDEEIRFALENNGLMFNVENQAELDPIRAGADAIEKGAPGALRLKP